MGCGPVSLLGIDQESHHCEGSGHIDYHNTNSFKTCTWNVEGLSDVKVVQVCAYMKDHRVGVCCIQQTRSINSEYYYTCGGFLVVLSGCAGSVHDFAGPIQLTNCMLKVTGGRWFDRSILRICSA